VPWYVAGGWAVELFLGTPTREHADIEIAIPAASWSAIRDRLGEYAVDAVGSGRIWADPTPEILAAVHQTWLRDPATGGYLLDVFREPHTPTPGSAGAMRRSAFPTTTSSATPTTASPT
jgi:hypothetical protein